MKKNKTENGITLVALIITIIILLILAVVAIGIVRGDGILFHAKDAATKYEEDVVEENTALKGYGDLILDATGKGPWTQDGLDITDGTISLKVGDKVNYDELSNGEKTYKIDHSQNGGTIDEELKTENLEWRVLGVNENGQVELISNKPTTSTLYLKGEEGYLNGITLLNEGCHTLYGQGQYAASGRSLKTEDINKLTNYDPVIQAKNAGYGEEWEYQISAEAEYMQYRKTADGGKTWKPDWTDIVDVNLRIFKIPGKVEINNSNPGIERLIYTDYGYTIEQKGLNTALTELITKGEENSEEITQWLASRAIQCNTERARFLIHVLNKGKVTNERLWLSNKYLEGFSHNLRPVVTLKASVKIENQVDGVWQIK